LPTLLNSDVPSRSLFTASSGLYPELIDISLKLNQPSSAKRLILPFQTIFLTVMDMCARLVEPFPLAVEKLPVPFMTAVDNSAEKAIDDGGKAIEVAMRVKAVGYMMGQSAAIEHHQGSECEDVCDVTRVASHARPKGGMAVWGTVNDNGLRPGCFAELSPGVLMKVRWV
jgi:hypothetical protein